MEDESSQSPDLSQFEDDPQSPGKHWDRSSSNLSVGFKDQSETQEVDGLQDVTFREKDFDGLNEVAHREKRQSIIGRDRKTLTSSARQMQSVLHNQAMAAAKTGHVSHFTRMNLANAMEATMSKLNNIKRRLKAAAFDSNAEEGVNWSKLFNKYDKDHSGEVDYEEFRAAIRKDAKVTVENLNDEMLKQLFDFLDKDSSGTISFQEEFIPWITSGDLRHKRKVALPEDRRNILQEKAEKKNVLLMQAAVQETKDMVKIAKRGLRAAAYAKGGVNWGKLFGKYDDASSGQIGFDTFRRALRKEAKLTQAMVSDQQLQLLFDFLDMSKKGSLDYREELVPWLEINEGDGGDRDSKLVEERVRSMSRTASRSILKGRQSLYSNASGVESGKLKGGASPAVDSTDLSMQIMQLSQLVKKQTREIGRLQSSHSEELRKLKIEQDALCTLLNTSGTVPTQSLEWEMHKMQQDPSKMDAQANLSSSQSSSSPEKDKGTARFKTLPQALDFDAGEDLFEICLPLLQRTTAQRQYDEAFRKLRQALRNGAKPDLWRGPGTPLLGAVQSGNLQLVDLLLDAHATVNVRNEKGVCPLHLASFRGQMDLCISLLDHLADPNVPDQHGQTPLFFAPIRMVCEVLFQRLADITLLNSIGQSAFHVAAKTGYVDVLLWFALHMPRCIADMNDAEGYTAHDLAVRANVNPKTLKRLRLWEPNASKLEWQHAKQSKQAGKGQFDDVGRSRPTQEMLAQIRHKLRAAAHWRGGVNWRQLFDTYDRSGSGNLNYVEFANVLRHGANVPETMISDDALYSLFLLLDADEGGTINYHSEFLPWLEPGEDDFAESDSSEDRKTRIQVLDTKLMGEVKRRLKAAAFQHGIVSWKALFRYYDRENSGEINYTEFRAAIRKSAKIPPSMVSDEQIKNLFDFLDVDSGGTVDYETEFLTWLHPDGEVDEAERKHGKTFQEQTKRALREAFENNVKQTKKAILGAAIDHGQINLKKMWRIYDKRETGKLGFEDFKAIIRKNARVKPQMLTEGHVASLFRQIDKNRDGMIDYEAEFLPWLELAKGDDEPAHYSFSAEAAERQRKKAAQALVKTKMGEIMDKLRTAAYDSGHANWIQLFRHYDRDDTGDMDFVEFQQLLRKRAKITPQHLSDEHLLALFEYVDQDRDGTISYDKEFLPLLEAGGVGREGGAGMNSPRVIAAHKRKTRLAKQDSAQTLKSIINKLRACASENALTEANWLKLFRYYDKDGSGEVNYQQFKSIIRTKAKIKQQEVPDDALKTLFEFLDVNKCGRINYESDFLPWLEHDLDDASNAGTPRLQTRQIRSPSSPHDDLGRWGR